MYQRKTPKSQKIDRTKYTIYLNKFNTEKWGTRVRIVSIDPGIRNFALRVESRSLLFKSQQIKTIVYDKLHIKDKDRLLDEDNSDHLYSMLSEFLNKYIEIFKTCHIVMVERQMSFNYKATRIAQHTLSYFMFNIGSCKQQPVIMEIDSKMKGRELNAPKNLNERGLKLWAVDCAKELLTLRKDYDALELLTKHKKKADDLADTVCQIEAFCKYMGWVLTEEYEEKNKVKLVIK